MTENYFAVSTHRNQNVHHASMIGWRPTQAQPTETNTSTRLKRCDPQAPPYIGYGDPSEQPQDRGYRHSNNFEG